MLGRSVALAVGVDDRPPEEILVGMMFQHRVEMGPMLFIVLEVIFRHGRQ